MWTLQRSGNVNFLFFKSLNVVHCSQIWVFVFCSNSVFLPIFGKMMGFGAKICRRRAKAAQRKCSQEFSALFRKRKTSFFGFLRQLLGLLMYDGHHWCTQASKFGFWSTNSSKKNFLHKSTKNENFSKIFGKMNSAVAAEFKNGVIFQILQVGGNLSKLSCSERTPT